MIPFTGRLSRRDWLAATAIGATGFSASGWLDVLAARAARAAAPPAARKAKSCIVLFLPGGISQLESWDMKPEAPVDWRGPFKQIDTAVPGLRICEHLPKLAGMMKDLALLRGMSTTGDHGAATKLVHHAGLFPRALPALRKPNLGSVISASLADPDFGIPTHVVLGGRGLQDRDMGGPGFLGARHQAMAVPEPARGLESLRAAVPQAEFDERLKLFEELELGFAQKHRLNAVEAHRVGLRSAVNFMRSKKARAFSLDEEPGKTRDAYGRNQFGEGCLMARRLVEIGIPFVEVKFQVALHRKNINGSALPWDTHTDVKDSALVGLPILDAAMSSLVRDLKDRGLYESTLVVCMSEMGRTPEPEKKGGRNHYPQVWTAVLGGAGVKTGLVVGKTSKDGKKVDERPISAVELLSTICQAVGIDPGLEFSSRDGMRADAKRTKTQKMAAGAPVQVLGGEAPRIKEVLG